MQGCTFSAQLIPRSFHAPMELVGGTVVNGAPSTDIQVPRGAVTAEEAMVEMVAGQVSTPASFT